MWPCAPGLGRAASDALATGQGSARGRLFWILLVANLFGAILLIPAFTALFHPRFVRAQAPPESRETSAAA